jgi:hypothetical protein
LFHNSSFYSLYLYSYVAILSIALVSLNEDGELDKPADIYAVGFQEIVDLNAGNIVAAR